MIDGSVIVWHVITILEMTLESRGMETLEKVAYALLLDRLDVYVLFWQRSMVSPYQYSRVVEIGHNLRVWDLLYCFVPHTHLKVKLHVRLNHGVLGMVRGVISGIIFN